MSVLQIGWRLFFWIPLELSWLPMGQSRYVETSELTVNVGSVTFTQCASAVGINSAKIASGVSAVDGDPIPIPSGGSANSSISIPVPT